MTARRRIGGIPRGARAGALAALVGAAGVTGAACSPAAPAAAFAAPAAPAPAAAAPAKVVQLNAPGAVVDVAAALPAGYVTVVDFWSQSCEACGPLGERLETGVAGEPRVVIRKVDVGDGDTPAAEAYKIAALPHFFIYDKQKRLRYDLVGPDCLEAARYARQLATE
jgi:thiol-disulfide isomerase/thioredoxin